MAAPRRVCVTGGGGFIASWLVKLLLSCGYVVHATLRNPCDPKNAHLKQLDKAPENLHLFKADVLDCQTLTLAIEGCEGVFHLATPVPEDKITDPESEVMAPAVKGTSNVLMVCSAMKVPKVIVLSSTAAIDFNPNWPQDILKDESCWSDKEFCMENEVRTACTTVICMARSGGSAIFIEKEREDYEVVIEDVKFLYKKSRQILDWSCGPRDAKWIFVLSKSKSLYVGHVNIHIPSYRQHTSCSSTPPYIKQMI